jgi:hypothetical protein
MTAAVDAELGGWRAQALERHLADCAECRQEQDRSERLDALLAGLPLDTPVSTQLEQDTLRRVRIAAADEAERPARFRLPTWITAPVLAAAAVLAVAVGVTRMSPTTTAGPAPEAPGVVPPVASVPAPAPRLAKAPPPRTADRAAAADVAPPEPVETPRVDPPPSDPSRRPDLPSEPPPELASAPDLFMDLNLLRNMEKLQHYDAIETTTLHEQDGEPPNG